MTRMGGMDVLQDSLEMSLLFDTYGELLTEKQKTCFDLYYNQDLSLAEIAEEEGISRQGVHDSIARAEAILRSYEQTLGCVKKERAQKKALDVIEQSVKKLKAEEGEEVAALAQAIEQAVNSLKE